MRKKLSVFMAFLMSALLLLGHGIEVKASVPSTTNIEIGQELTYSGVTESAYTFQSSDYEITEKVAAVVFNVSVVFPEGAEEAWNDWCGEVIKVTAGDVVSYYDFGGAGIGWGVDMDGDDVPDTSGVDTDSWVGTVTNGKGCTVAVPVNASDFTIDFYDNCWDTATDISHLKINDATILYGEYAHIEKVAVDKEMTYTGLENPGFTFSDGEVASEGSVSFVVLDMSVVFPEGGEATWNDWCGEVIRVTIGDEVFYYDFGGAGVGWGVDMDGDDVPNTSGVGTESWAGTTINNTISVVVPINADKFTIDIFDNCWDTATDVSHLKVNNATVLLGTVTSLAEKEEPVVEAEPEKVIPEFDASADYEAFLCIQTNSYAFRNNWDDPGFGLYGSEWESRGIENTYNTGICGWVNNELNVTDAAFENCEITGNGTYKVRLSDFDFGNDTSLNTLYVSTTIPLTEQVKITDVTVYMDGNEKYTFDNAVVAGIDTKDSKDYLEVHCINIWNKDQLNGSTGLFDYSIPTDTIEIEFTISGFEHDKAEEVVEATPEVIPDESQATEESQVTGAPVEEEADSSAGIIILIVVLCTVIVAIAVVIVKRKK